jgi:hypothetical protein
MKSRPLLAIALLLTTPVLGLAKSPTEQDQRTRLKMLRLESESFRPNVRERAYLDAYKVLDSGNSCGSFFGGAARSVLEELVLRLREQTILDTRIGIRMSGRFTMQLEPNERIEYRLFERADVNTVGPFYRTKSFPSEQYVPNMGSFGANTREARVLILLHELGHLIKRNDGRWLIPDDGDDPQLSRLNTMTVESKCTEQIRSL